MKRIISIFLCCIMILQFVETNVSAKERGRLTVHTIISGDPSVVLTSNAKITLASSGFSETIIKPEIIKGGKVIKNAVSGVYNLKTKNIQTAGYECKITLNGKETTSIPIDLSKNQELTIEMFYTKINFSNLPCEVLDVENELNFYNPIYGLETQVLTDSDCCDDSSRFQKLIDDVSNAGGGTLFVKSGNYYINDISLKSNVHIKTESNVVFHLGNSLPVHKQDKVEGKGSMFKFGGDQQLTNVSIESIDPRTKYTINLDTHKFKTSSAFYCRNVKNFKIADALIQGDYTAYSKIGMGAGSANDIAFEPNYGVVSNIDCYNVVYGYGLVQVQAAQNILFKNLYSQGGITLRLENGVIQYVGEKTPRTNGIYGRNIYCENGCQAFMSQDHGIPTGYFDIRGVYAKSCCAAVDIGSSNSNSILRDVQAIYGEKAQLKTKDLYKLPVCLTSTNLTKNVALDLRDPKNQQNGGFTAEGTDTRVWEGPSVCAVILWDGIKLDFSEKDVTLCEGFKEQINNGKVLESKKIALLDGTIVDKDRLKITGLDSVYEVTGSPIEPKITIEYDGKQFVENKDYTLEYTNNVKIGTANLLINFRGEYCYYTNKTFEIVKTK